MSAAPSRDTGLRQARRSQQERREQARERLIEAAILRIQQRGYHGATLQQIAADAGLSKANALYHFATRAQLMAAVAGRVYAETRASIASAIVNRPAGQSIAHAFAIEAWAQFKRPQNMASLEILVAARSDPDLSAAVQPVLAHSATDAQRYYQAMLTADASPWAAEGEMHYVLGLALLRGLMLEHFLSGDPRVDQAADYWINTVTAGVHGPGQAPVAGA
jgi:AcrR family transcriptional regulator